ncbi:hypothetical protein ACF0H5_018987 [Mactra antiquata]
MATGCTIYKYLFLFCVCFGLCSGIVNNLGFCTGVTQCHCKFDNGQYLKLDSLGKTDGTSRFVNVSDSHEMSYSWNPCYNATQGSCFIAPNVAICAIQPSLPRDLYMILGDSRHVTFTTNQTDRAVTMVYKTEQAPIRTSYVKLICINESESYFKAIGQKYQTSTNYYFELRSKAACPQGEPILPSTPKPVENPTNKTLEAVLIVVSVVALCFMVSLILVVLKMKGKICKSTEDYDAL